MLSHVWLFATPWTVAHQTPLFMEFSGQEYRSGLPCLPPGDLPNPGIKLVSPVTLPLQADSLLLSYRGSPPSRSYLNLITSQRPTSENHHTEAFNMWIFRGTYSVWGFPGDSDGKESVCSEGDWSSMPGLWRTPGEGNGYPLQSSCLENSMDRGVWRATVHGVTKSQTWLSD